MNERRGGPEQDDHHFVDVIRKKYFREITFFSNSINIDKKNTFRDIVILM